MAHSRSQPGQPRILRLQLRKPGSNNSCRLKLLHVDAKTLTIASLDVHREKKYCATSRTHSWRHDRLLCTCSHPQRVIDVSSNRVAAHDLLGIRILHSANTFKLEYN